MLSKAVIFGGNRRIFNESWRIFGAQDAPSAFPSFIESARVHEVASNVFRMSVRRFLASCAAFESKISWPKASLRSEKTSHLLQRASKGSWCLFCTLCVRRWPQSCGFSKFCMQNRAHFDRKFAQFRCRTCAQDARNLRTLILNTFDAIACTLALSGKLGQALGASCAPKMRHDSLKILRFPPKIS